MRQNANLPGRAGVARDGQNRMNRERGPRAILSLATIYQEVTYSVPSTERLLNAKHFSRLPPKSVARKRHSGRPLYAKAQSEPYAREENATAAGLPTT